MPTSPQPSTRGDGPWLDVAVVAAWRLVGETVQMALAVDPLRVARHSLPDDCRRVPELVQQLAGRGARALVVLCDVEGSARFEAPLGVLAASPVPCLVLVERARAKERIALEAAGAVAVLPMSTGVDELHAMVVATATGSAPPRVGVKSILGRRGSGQQAAVPIRRQGSDGLGLSPDGA